MDDRPASHGTSPARAPWTAPALESPEDALAHEHAALDAREALEALDADVRREPPVPHDDTRRAGKYTRWIPA